MRCESIQTRGPPSQSCLKCFTHTAFRTNATRISILDKAAHGQSAVARLMDRHKTTIGRELQRNRGKRSYRPKQAHEFSLERKQACQNGPRVAAQTWRVVESRLKGAWSPQQINGQPGVSHESIYRRICADKRKGGSLQQDGFTLPMHRIRSQKTSRCTPSS